MHAHLGLCLHMSIIVCMATASIHVLVRVYSISMPVLILSLCLHMPVLCMHAGTYTLICLFLHRGNMHE